MSVMVREKLPSSSDESDTSLLLSYSSSDLTSPSQTLESYHSNDKTEKKKKFIPQKKDGIFKIYEKQKLKNKSISKKLNTPCDRKVYGTCWPIQMRKICRIEPKPTVKEAVKPDETSLTKSKFSDPTIFSNSRKRRRSNSSSDSD